MDVIKLLNGRLQSVNILVSFALFILI